MTPDPTGSAVLRGIHHLKFAVSDIARGQAFYEAALGAVRLGALDHRRPDGALFAIIMRVPGLGTMLELRLNPAQATAQAGFDPVTLAVDGLADLERWAAHLDKAGLRRSAILVGLVGWVLVTEDPDGRRIRFYTAETHGPEIAMTYDEAWLGPM